jgi:hypothetical protein
MHNPLSFEKISKLLQTMFPIVVNSKHFYLLLDLCFDKAFEFLKLWNTFFTSWKAHKKVLKIIYEGNKIPSTIEKQHSNMSSNIWMDKF